MMIDQLTRELASRIHACGLRYDCLSGGVSNAEIAFIGQQPGYEEAKLKQPFETGVLSNSPNSRVVE